MQANRAGATGMIERSICRLGVAALLLASTTPVFAADLPAKAPIYKAPVAVPAFGLGNIQNTTISTEVREHIFRLGANYKFF
jgi:hypothetical protein